MKCGGLAKGKVGILYPMYEQVLEQFKAHLRGEHPEFLTQLPSDGHYWKLVKQNLRDLEINILECIRQTVNGVNLSSKEPAASVSEQQQRQDMHKNLTRLKAVPTEQEHAPSMTTSFKVEPSNFLFSFRTDDYDEERHQFDLLLKQKEQELADEVARDVIYYNAAEYLVKMLSFGGVDVESLEQTAKKKPETLSYYEYKLNILFFVGELLHQVNMLHLRSDILPKQPPTNLEMVELGRSLIEHLEPLKELSKDLYSSYYSYYMDVNFVEKSGKVLEFAVKAARNLSVK